MSRPTPSTSAPGTIHQAVIDEGTGRMTLCKSTSAAIKMKPKNAHSAENVTTRTKTIAEGKNRETKRAQIMMIE